MAIVLVVAVINFVFSYRSKPLQIWDKHVRNGHIKRVTDPDIQSSVIEIMGTNVSLGSTTIFAPDGDYIISFYLILSI